MPSPSNRLATEIRRLTNAEVHEDEIHRRIYSVDASIYEVEPAAIAIPKTKQDLVTILKLAADAKIPVIPRGAATGITGGCIGKGLILDLSKYLNQILEINIDKGYVICQPGVVQDHLNAALFPYGYRLGPDTSTGNRATIGGMLANNAAGARSLKYGCMADHVLEVELALAGGTLTRIGEVSEDRWHADYTALDLIRQNRSEIEKRFPKIPRHVSGYNLDRLIGSFPLNLSPLIAGSEGTLGVATEIKLSISPLPESPKLYSLEFDSMTEAMQAVPELLEHRPIALEMIDDKIIEMARLSPAVNNKLGWIKGNPKAILVAELEHGSLGEPIASPQDVWDVRKAGLGLLLSKRTYNRAIAFIEDISVAPDKLAAFLPEFQDYLKSRGKEAGIYGHAGSGCLHIRPYVDLRSPDEAGLMQEIQNDVAAMLLKYGGALSGEHGDGLVRSWQNEKMFGNQIYQLFKRVKAAFDPRNLMNPGKIVDAPAFLENLRTRGQPEKIETFLDFSREGGFELAVDLCNGNAMCRKKEGLMCPSYQATEDEYDTTRARAQTLRSIITGRMPKEKLNSPEVLNVLDLCLECKGCKRECPSQVDMAKMKAELLYQAKGFSPRSYLFSHIGPLQKMCAPIATLFNWIGNSWIVKKLSGIATKRSLPSIATQRFSAWFKTYKQPAHDKSVALFNDTYTEFNHPEIGKAAVSVLNKLGYTVRLIPWKCCGRPMISKGFLKQAKSHAQELAASLDSYQVPILVLEPSCHSALIDDYRGLIGKTCDVQLFESFVAGHALKLKEPQTPILRHTHCHQKALTDPVSIPGLKIEEIDSGCCGMAGSFGYEKEHYDLSMKIGSLKLFPTINQNKEAVVVACGMSCRHQITHGTGRQVRHIAELLDEVLDF